MRFRAAIATVLSALALTACGGSSGTSSTSSCHTFGCPEILFLDRAGTGPPTDSMRSTHDFFGNAAEGFRRLRTGTSAYP